MEHLAVENEKRAPPRKSTAIAARRRLSMATPPMVEILFDPELARLAFPALDDQNRSATHEGPPPGDLIRSPMPRRVSSTWSFLFGAFFEGLCEGEAQAAGR